MAALPLPSDAAPLRWPDRTHLDLHDELHARPALAVQCPGVVSYWVQWGMEPAAAEAGTRHHLLQTATFALKYERHGEFASWQVNRPLAEPPEHCDDAQLQRWLHEVRALDAVPREFADAINKSGSAVMTLPGVVASPGGLPILRDGKVIGGLGVSGMTGDQDEQCAKTGLASAGK